MTNPNPDNGLDANLSGGPPMVKIDGPAVRRIREQAGLTQLYVATVVQVTTDTISRWENRRYPSIKKENAEKLAEALGVVLDDLLERQEAAERVVTAELPGPGGVAPPEPAAPVPSELPVAPMKRRRWLVLAGVGLLLLVAVSLGRFYLAGNREVLPQVTATRVLPEHVPPGQDFPVLLKVSSLPPATFALIVRENLPPGCRFGAATPASTGPGGREDQIKWVSRLEGGERLFAYRLTSPVPGRSGSELRFQGQVVAGARGETPVAVTGGERMAIAPYHWADRDGDYRIDDEEILWVYEVYGTLEGLDDLRDEVDNIWTAGGYGWDGRKFQYKEGPVNK